MSFSAVTRVAPGIHMVGAGPPPRGDGVIRMGTTPDDGAGDLGPSCGDRVTRAKLSQFWEKTTER